MASQKRPPAKSPETRKQEERIRKEQQHLVALKKKDQARGWAQDIRRQSNALLQKLETDTTIPYQTPTAEIRTLRRTLHTIAPQMSAVAGFILGVVVTVLVIGFLLVLNTQH